jgi:hypothetical protein
MRHLGENLLKVTEREVRPPSNVQKVDKFISTPVSQALLEPFSSK